MGSEEIKSEPTDGTSEEESILLCSPLMGGWARWEELKDEENEANSEEETRRELQDNLIKSAIAQNKKAEWNIRICKDASPL